MLAAKRGIAAVKRFFRKMMRADHRRLPFSISTDKHASYPEAFTAMQVQKVLAFDCRLRRTKYLTNIVKQDHRFIRRRWRSVQVFGSFHTAQRAIEGM
jgi:IS6 family transposase